MKKKLFYHLSLTLFLSFAVSSLSFAVDEENIFTTNIGIGASGTLGLLQVGTSPNTGSPGLLVTPGGNVGIGKTAPAYKLDVSGEIKSDSALFLASSVNIDGTTSSVDQKLASYSSALYWGRSKITSDVFDEGLHNFGNVWNAKGISTGWNAAALSADGSRQAAVVNGGQIYISSDYGNTWAAKDTARGWWSVAISADGSRSTAVVLDGQIYISSDYGSTWAAKDTARAWYSVAISADGSRQTATVYATTGPNGYLYISSDYGNTWTAKLTDANRSWRGIAISADGSRSTALDYGSGSGGQIYISSDYGNTWAAKDTARGWWSVAISADGSRQAAVVNSASTNGYIYISSDYGSTWAAKMTDANRNWWSVAMSSDGARQSAVVSNGQIYISSDYGNTWTAKMTDANRDWQSVDMSADGSRSTAVVNSGQIYISTAGKTKFLDNVGIGETNPAGLLQVGTTPTPGLLVTSVGNVGIGKTGPAHKLDVSGNIGLSASAYLNFGATDGDSGYGFKDSAGTVQYKNSSASWTSFGGGAPPTPAGADGQAQYNNAGVLGGALNLYYDDSGNNVGIGATSPRGLLQVGTSPNLGSPGLLVTAAGNVGIGKTAPAYKLDVTGEIKSNSALFLASAVNIEGTTSSVDQKLASYTSALYWGRSKITSDVFDEGLHNFGNSWTVKMDDSSRQWYAVAMSGDGRYQTAADNFGSGSGGQIYISSDYGNTWTAKGSNRYWYSVVMSADGSRSTAVVKSGTTTGYIYISSDYGSTWTAKMTDANRNWNGVAISADGARQAVVDNGSGSGGQIYISTDYGSTWAAKESNRTWFAVAMSADGSRQAAVVSTGQIYISTDYGSTWTARDTSRVWRDVAMSADGARQTAVVNSTTTNGYIYISSDYGSTWAARMTDANRGWQSVAMSADGSRQVAGDGSPGKIYISTDYGSTWAAKEGNRVWYSLAMSSDGSRSSAVVAPGFIYLSAAEKTKFLDNVGIGETSPVGLLQVGTTPTPGLFVTSAGNLGIGNTGPVHKLDVSGNIGLSASGYLNFGATDGDSGYGFKDNAGTVQYKNSSGSWAALGSGGGTPTGADGQAQYNNAGGLGGAVNLYYDDIGNNVGIGTTGPLGLLQVGTSPNTGSPGLLVTSSGNVGIGKTAPAYKLEVTGEIKSDSALFLASAVNIEGTTSSVDQKLASYTSALYWGRSKITSDVFDEGLHNFGNVWNAKGTSASWNDVALSADGSRQTAGVINGLIYISTDYGSTWTARMTDANRNWDSVAMSADGSRQTAVVSSATTNGYIYISTDYGSTWAARMTDSNRLWFSVAMSADGSRSTAVVQNSQIYISSDYGSTWAAKMTDANRNWASVAMSTDGSRSTAVAPGYFIYISSDYGSTWTAKDTVRNWQAVAMSADGLRQAAVVYNGQIYISSDYGSTWAAKETNRDWNSVAMSSDGSRQTAVVSSATTDGYIYISTDYGSTWAARMTDANRVWRAVAMSADGNRSTAVVSGNFIYISAAEKTRFLDNVGIGLTNPLGLLQVGTTPTPGLLVTSAGNLGIGNTAPLHKLDVSGNIGLSASAYLNFGAADGDSGYGFKDNAGTIQYKNISGGWTDLGGGAAPTAGGADGQVQYNNNSVMAGAVNLYYDDIGNNVGIGTTGPLGLLQVGTSPNLGSPGLLVTAAGNVGIGKTAPTYKLDVSGDIKASSALFLTSAVNIDGATSSVDQKLASYTSSLYWGRSKITSDVFDEGLYNFGNTWTAKMTDANREWMRVAISSDGARLTALVQNGQIYASSDYGNTWAAKESNRNWRGIAISADGSRQAAVVYNGQIYVSSDYGNTWAARMTDTNRVWYGVAMSADGAYSTAVDNGSGGGGQIYVSSDYGSTWSAKESNRTWSAVAMSSDGARQTALVSSVSATGYIYVSTDYGSTWAPKMTDANRTWSGVAMSADGSHQSAAAGGDKIYISSDYGSTWAAKESNRNWVTIAMSGDGARSTAAVSSPGQIYISTDYGSTWAAKESNRTWRAVAMSADGCRQAAVDGAPGYIYISATEKTQFLDNVGIGMTNPISLLQVGTSPGTATVLLVSANANVGIGKTSPLHKLDVSGNIGLSASGYINFGTADGDSGYGFKDNAGTIQYKNISGGWTDFAAGAAPTPAGADGTVQYNNDGTMAGAANFYYDDTGAGNNVGIGTTGPVGLLQVGTSPNIGSPGLLVTAAGNVGIGKTAPAYKLDVTGEIKASSALFLSSSVNISGTTSSADQKLASYTSALYWGRSKIASDVFDEGLYNFGNLWIAKMTDASRLWRGIALSADGSRQAAVVGGGQIYISSDYGSTWAAKDTVRTWYDLALSADGSRQSAVVYSATSTGYIYISTDYGSTWAARMTDANRLWRGIALSADGSRQSAVEENGYIYVSSDYGNTWAAKDTVRTWYDLALSADGSRQSAVVYSATSTGYIYISTDYGNTWAARMTDTNRPWLGIAISADGSRQSAGVENGYIYISSDYGSTWAARMTDTNRIWRAIALSADGARQSAGAYGGQIYISTDYGSTWAAREGNRAWYSLAMSNDGSRSTAVAVSDFIYVSAAEKTKFLDNVGIGMTNPLGLLQVGTSPRPGLFVTSNGNVGIGNTKPLAMLQAGTSPNQGLSVTTAGNVGIGTTAPAELLQAGPSPNPALTVTTTGNVGIGKTNPQARLVVRGSGTTTAIAFNLEDNTGADKVTILDNGNVGIGTIAPTSSLHIMGSQSVKRTAVAGDYTVLVSDYYISVTSTAAARTITLPAAATAGEGKVYFVKDDSGGAATNQIYLDPAGAETIDGAATKTINTNYGAVRVISSGAAWFTW